MGEKKEHEEKDQEQVSPVISEISVDDPAHLHAHDSKTDELNPDINDSIESIRILEPGRYNLNLVRLAESDDRVIKVGADGKYRLDLNSMMRRKKKQN